MYTYNYLPCARQRSVSPLVLPWPLFSTQLIAYFRGMMRRASVWRPTRSQLDPSFRESLLKLLNNRLQDLLSWRIVYAFSGCVMMTTQKNRDADVCLVSQNAVVMSAAGRSQTNQRKKSGRFQFQKSITHTHFYIFLSFNRLICLVWSRCNCKWKGWVHEWKLLFFFLFPGIQYWSVNGDHNIHHKPFESTPVESIVASVVRGSHISSDPSSGKKGRRKHIHPLFSH